MAGKLPFKKENIKNILLMFLCGLGDSVCLAPVVERIRNNYPDARIVILTAGSGKNIWPKMFGSIETIAYDRSGKSKVLSIIKTLILIRKGRFDLAISRAPVNSIRIPILAILSGAKYRVGARYEKLSFLYNIKAEVDKGMHSIDKYAQLLSVIGCQHGDRAIYPVLHDDKQCDKEVDQIFEEAGFGRQPIIAFASGADVNIRGDWKPEMKRWLEEGYAEVASWLVKNKKSRIVMVGLPNEYLIAERIKKISKANILNLCGKTSIGSLQSVLKRCAALVSNDTGTMHLAAASRVPVIALFGPTDPMHFGPIGENHHVIIGQAPCSPCYPVVRCTLKHCEAMASIGPRQVIEILSGLELS